MVCFEEGCLAGGAGAMTSTFSSALQFFAAAQCLLAEPWPTPANVPDASRYDFIVVGGGTAGAALAARLAEMKSFSVLLVEAGGLPPQEAIVPGFKDSLKGSPYDWNFTTVNDFTSSQALQGGSQRQPRGKLLGGSGSINDMVYSRGFPVDYDEWAHILDDQSWSFQSVLEYFKKTEHLTDERIINDPELMKYHARNGDIEVAGLNVSTFETDIYLKGFEEMGFEMVKDMTYPKKIGAGRFSHTIKSGRRDSSVTGLLNPATKYSNLHVLTNALVSKILISNSIAFGIQVIVDHKIKNVFVKKEIIVSAGTFNTPKLLMLSGIGPKQHLQHFGIKVKSDLPVGDNLHDHVMVLNFIAADNGTCHSDVASKFFEAIQYLKDQTGKYSRTNSMGAYIATKEDPNVPEFAIYPSCIPIKTSYYSSCVNLLGFNDQICSKLQSVLEDRELITVAVVLLKPKSRGFVQLQSTDPSQPPLIYSGTFSVLSDLEKYPKAIATAMALAKTSHFAKLNAEVIDLNIEGCENFVSEYELMYCKAHAMATSAWHAVGTAAMGSVVDSKLRVKGILNLRVADASVMPKVVRGNTNAPVIMIAERAVDFIKEQYSDKQVNAIFRQVSSLVARGSLSSS